MKNLHFNKEFVLLIIPLIITGIVNSISNYFSFHQKSIEFYRAANADIKEFNEKTKNQLLFANFLISEEDHILHRKDKILSLYKSNIGGKRASESETEWLYQSAMQVSKTLGAASAFRSAKMHDTLSAAFLVNFLENELNLINSVRLNKKDKDILLEYLQSEGQYTQGGKISNLLFRTTKTYFEDENEKKTIDAETFLRLSYLNLIMVGVLILLLIFVIYYSNKKRLFKK